MVRIKPLGTHAYISINQEKNQFYTKSGLDEWCCPLIYNISYFKDGLVNHMNNALAINSNSSGISSAHSTNPQPPRQILSK